jgi:alpha-1,6-mannosyltransferase
MQRYIKSSGILLGVCFSVYLFLSWILLFRDKRALTGISHFYPSFHSLLFNLQIFLLHHNLNTIPTFVFAILICAAFFFYFQSLKQNISVKKTIIYSLMFGFILFISYPILSTDIFSYIFSDRIATVYHQNVWQVVPLTHNADPFAIMADWKNTTRVYGGVNQLIYTIPSTLGGNNIVFLVILYKFVSGLFAAGIIWILYLLLKHTEKNKNIIARNMRILIWNPLFLIELFGSGHNESIMIFFTLLSYLFFQRKRFFLTGFVLACAVQVKIIPILLFTFLIISLLQKKAFKNIISLIASFILVNTISFWLMATSPVTFAQRVSYNAGVYWQSLPNLFRYMNFHNSYFFTGFFLLIFCLLIFYQIRSKQNPLLFYAYALVIYLFFFATAYWNWYSLWVLTVIPLLQNPRFKFFIISFTFTSLMAYPLYWLSLRYDYQSIIWPIVTYLFVFILPVIILLLTWRKKLAKQVALLD